MLASVHLLVLKNALLQEERVLLVEIDEFLQSSSIQIAIVAVPASVTKDILNQLYHSGIKAVLNYAPFTPLDHKDMIIRNIDPVASLQSLTYHLKENN